MSFEAASRSTFVVAALAFAGGVSLACDKSGPLADLTLDASSAPPPAVSTIEPPTSMSPPDAGRIMPPRPVPTSSPTVTITMPERVQLEAIQYMAAMQAPQPSDAAADPDYAKEIADRLRSLGKVDVMSSGRRIDVVMAKGCDANAPRNAITQHTAASMTTLLSHGVLVIRCADKGIQCLQSTRDVDDVLCTRR